MADVKQLPPRRYLPPLAERPTAIYVLCDPNTDEIRYVGQTVSKLKYRLTGHVCASRQPSSYVQCWIKSVGKPKIQALMVAEGRLANDVERAVIKRFRERGYRLVNTEEGGRSGLQRRLTEEQRRKFSARMMGHFTSEETKRKISEAHKGKVVRAETREKLRLANLGKKHSEETKAKMVVSRTGKKASPETLERLRIVNTGRKMAPHAEEWKAMMSQRFKGAGGPMYGKTHSPEARAKIRTAKTGTKLSPEHRAKMCVVQKERRERERLERLNV